MAGRGTDIKLGEGVAELGGLFILGTERHESRRIDRQLRGRCSRQGDPGLTKFYLSLEDDLMRLFLQGNLASKLMEGSMQEGEELEHPWLNRSIESAQKKVEQQNYSIRKRLLQYDDVLNQQREVVYGIRNGAIHAERPKDIIFEQIEEELSESHEPAEAASETPSKSKKPKKQIVYTDVQPELRIFQNAKGMRRTIPIDSMQLAKFESEDPAATKDKAASELRAIVNSVGRIGKPGQDVRCVVSVSMLTEGWDANNVTHIFGLRAFGSQLLCEQVVGRGLRRMNYDPDPDTGLLPEEYVDVYGIPFSVIPYKGKPSSTPPDRPVNFIRADLH